MQSRVGRVSCSRGAGLAEPGALSGGPGRGRSRGCHDQRIELRLHSTESDVHGESPASEGLGCPTAAHIQPLARNVGSYRLSRIEVPGIPSKPAGGSCMSLVVVGSTVDEEGERGAEEQPYTVDGLGVMCVEESGFEE